MEDGHSGTDALEGLPAAYASWRASTLGQITDRLELDLMLEMIGPTSGLRVLDVGCGDGVLAVELWKRGSVVTGLDASREMITAARSHAGREAAEIKFAIGAAETLPFPAEMRAALESVPDVCLLDPDGDIVRRLKREGRDRRHEGWVCYHTELYVFEEDGLTLGVVGCAVGASFAVLVAEELFASGCRLLISITSSGQLRPIRTPPYFVLIERALRDEGTSYHYLPPSTFSEAPEGLLKALEGAFDDLPEPVLRGATWTTDAPFRETEDAIEAMRGRGLLAVEMEAAALYAFARARGRRVVCFAHVTNQMGQIEGDFEKGEADGTQDALGVAVRAARRLLKDVPRTFRSST